MGKLIIPIGISGSGKSTYRSKLQDAAVICLDDIRKELSDINDQTINKRVFEIAHSGVVEALKAGHDVYFDATNLIDQYIIELLEACKGRFDQVIFVSMITSGYLEECWSRIQSREDGANTPRFVLEKQQQQWYQMGDSLNYGALAEFLEGNNIRYQIAEY